MTIKRIKIHSYEKGFHFRNGEFIGLMETGKYWFLNPFVKDEVAVSDMREAWITHGDLDLIVKDGSLDDKAEVFDLNDYERALVWIDGRFNAVLRNGQYAIWTQFRKVKVEIVDARTIQFVHQDLTSIMNHPMAKQYLDEFVVKDDHAGVLFINGEYIETLKAGRYAFWKGVHNVQIYQVDLSEQSLDISGQDIMTLDKVTLRINAVLAYTVIDAEKAVRCSANVQQGLYREAQLALRAIVGGRELDDILSDKTSVAEELNEKLTKRCEMFGFKLSSLGIRDIILPGDMKELLNKVTEAKKAAEANLIARREETAAMRSQANTAKLLENNPVLMRLRELEVLEKISTNSKLNVVLGEKGLAERVVNLL